MKKLIALILSLSLFLSFGISCFADSPNEATYPISTNEEEIPVNNFYDAIDDTEFISNGVIYVTMHHHISDVGKEYTENDFPELDIELIEDITSADLNDKKEDYGENFRNILKITLKDKSRIGVINSIKRLQNRAGEDIYWVDPTYNTSFFVESCITPNDNKYYEQIGDSMAYDLIQLEDAWEYTTGSNSIKVAVVDGGIKSDHPDLINNLLPENTTILTSSGGINPNLSLSHGTQCAGIIGAEGNNGIGYSGVCWDVSIVPIVYASTTATGVSFVTMLIDYYRNLVLYLNTEDIDITNISMSWQLGVGIFTTIEGIVNNYKGLIVCSAGNKSKNNDALFRIPSCLDCNNVISVGVSTRDDAIWYRDENNGSNYGNSSVDIFAPGNDTYTTVIDEIEYYKSGGGTSMSAPLVAGVAALIQSVNPNLTNLQTKAIILNTSDRNDAFIGKSVSGGRLNAYEAVRIAHGLATGTLSESDINKAEYLFEPVYGSTVTEDGTEIIDYTDETFTIDKCVSDREDITLPQYFRGKSITKINSRAFDANTSTTTVTIPASIVPESHAFNSGAVLKTVIFANGTTSIPQHLFHSCQNVTHVYIPDTVETIGAGALSDFSTVFTTYDGYAYNYAVNEGYSACGISGDSITHYSESTYANTYDIVLPSYFFGTEINTIYHQAFDGADDIVSIEIPNTVETIGRRAFRNCDLLRTVIIPPSVTSISNSMNSTIVEGSSNAVIFCRFGTYAYAYSQSTDATFVYMSIDDNTHTASVVGFKEGTGWSKELYIPETFMGYDVTSVGISAFNNSGSNGYNITKVYLPETVTSIGMRAFFSCDDLTYIYIPSAETTIGEVCFSPLVTNGLVVHCVLSSPAFVYAVTHNHSYQPI